MISKAITARVRHYCQMCGRWVGKGEKYYKWNYSEICEACYKKKKKQGFFGPRR